MLEMASDAATTEGLTDDAVQELHRHNIWAMYLTPKGEAFGHSICRKKYRKIIIFRM
jgi:hypothetical protein